MIIGMLLALLLPAVQASRAAAWRSSCSNNMKQIGLAIQSYESSFKVFPPSSTSDITRWRRFGRRYNNHSWASLILPYVEMDSLADTIDYSISSMQGTNLAAASTVVPIYRCPAYTGPDFSQDINCAGGSRNSSDYNYAIGNYVAMGASDVGRIWGVSLQPYGALFPLSQTSPADVRDGLSNTILIVESREERMRVWIDGRTAAFTALRYDRRNHPTYAGTEVSLNYTPYYDGRTVKSDYGPSSMHSGGGAAPFRRRLGPVH